MSRKIAVCPVYSGLTDEEALRLRFGSDRVPKGLNVVMLHNALPPDGIGFEWGHAPRDSARFKASWARLERCTNAEGECQKPGAVCLPVSG